MNTQETVVPRLAVRRFAEAMERALRWNDHKDTWREQSFAELLAKLAEEVGEVAHAYRSRSAQELADECADVAVVALMIWESQTQQWGDTDGRGREYPPDPDADGERTHEREA